MPRAVGVEDPFSRNPVRTSATHRPGDRADVVTESLQRCLGREHAMTAVVSERRLPALQYDGTIEGSAPSQGSPQAGQCGCQTSV